MSNSRRTRASMCSECPQAVQGGGVNPIDATIERSVDGRDRVAVILRSHVSFRNDPDLPVPLPVKGCLGQAKALST